MDYAEKYRQKHGDSNQRIRESDLAELKARVTLSEAVADKAAALMRTAGVIEKDKISAVSFHPHMFNELADAIAARQDVFPDEGYLIRVNDGVSGNIVPQGPTFHWRDGWMFARGEGLCIHVWNIERGIDLTIPRGEWDSIISELAENK